MKAKIDIDHTCALAQLQLAEDEKIVLIPQMARIVEWVGKLDELQLELTGDDVCSPGGSSLPFREDEVLPSLPLERTLAGSPDKDRNFIKVPKVIEGK